MSIFSTEKSDGLVFLIINRYKRHQWLYSKIIFGFAFVLIYSLIIQIFLTFSLLKFPTIFYIKHSFLNTLLFSFSIFLLGSVASLYFSKIISFLICTLLPVYYLSLPEQSKGMYKSEKVNLAIESNLAKDSQIEALYTAFSRIMETSGGGYINQFSGILNSNGAIDEVFWNFELGILKSYLSKREVRKSDIAKIYKEHNNSDSEYEKCILYLKNQKECEIKSQIVFEKEVNRISTYKYENFAKYIKVEEKLRKIWDIDGNINTYQKYFQDFQDEYGSTDTIALTMLREYADGYTRRFMAKANVTDVWKNRMRQTIQVNYRNDTSPTAPLVACGLFALSLMLFNRRSF